MLTFFTTYGTEVLLAVVILIVGYMVFKKLEKGFAEELQ